MALSSTKYGTFSRKVCHFFQCDERKRQKLTQQLGERIGKKREYISSLEQGQTDMQLPTFMLIANALACDSLWL